jgi:DNA polymerase-3 subunit delta
MRYKQLIAFEKHLLQSSKHPLSRVYLVISACPYERSKILQRVLDVIVSRESDSQLIRRDASEGHFSSALEELRTLSFFASQKIVYLDQVDKLKKAELSLLANYVEQPSQAGYLILGSSRALNDLYERSKKELVVCDLSEEKPWELQKRLKGMLVDYAALSSKRLNPDALEYLLETVGSNLCSLEREVDKLVSYGVGRAAITLADVQTLCVSSKEQTLWHLVDAVAWGDTYPQLEAEGGFDLLLPLISQLRTQFQQGLGVATLLARKVPLQDLSHHMPHLKPHQLTKILNSKHAKDPSFFKEALSTCFQAELMAKNSSVDPAAILDLFISKLFMLKSVPNHALLIAQSPR